MSFPAMNAQVVSGFIGGSVGAVTTNQLELLAGTAVHSFFKVPAVVDVTGMEFGATVAARWGTAASVTSIASGVSTITFVMADGGTTGSAPGSTNHLTLADPLSATAGFDNKGQSWTNGELVGVTGSSTTDLDADDVLGVHLVANLTTAAGFGHMRVSTAYIYGKPSSIN
jgi:hypothetical protein